MLILIDQILDGNFNYLHLLISNPIYEGLIVGFTGNFNPEIMHASITTELGITTIESESSNGIHWFSFNNQDLYSSVFDYIYIDIDYEGLDVNQDQIWDILDIDREGFVSRKFLALLMRNFIQRIVIDRIGTKSTLGILEKSGMLGKINLIS